MDAFNKGPLYAVIDKQFESQLIFYNALDKLHPLHCTFWNIFLNYGSSFDDMNNSAGMRLLNVFFTSRHR